MRAAEDKATCIEEAEFLKMNGDVRRYDRADAN
jgi:hypothetical protein